jgi:RHS repeat-associated protein
VRRIILLLVVVLCCWRSTTTRTLALTATGGGNPSLADASISAADGQRALYLNPHTGRFWTMDSFEGSQSDPLSLHKYLYCHANPVNMSDPSGKWGDGLHGQQGSLGARGHSNFPGSIDRGGPFDYTEEDRVHSPMNTTWMWRHFRPLQGANGSEPEIREAIRHCDVVAFEETAHQMQDFFSHFGQGFHTWHDLWINYPFQGHGAATVGTAIARGAGFGVARPDNAEDYRDAFEAATGRTQYWWDRWNHCCMQLWDYSWVLKPGISGADLDAPLPPDIVRAPGPTPTRGYWQRGWNTSVTGITVGWTTLTGLF